MTRTIISGVYSITNLKNGWRYVGSSENVQDRLLRHQEKLEARIHYLRRLQNDWGKHGRSAFDFEVLEQYSGPELVIREQAWINKFAQDKKLYNVALSAARNGSRKVKSDWVGKVQKKAESEVVVSFDEKEQAAHDRAHRKLGLATSWCKFAGYALFLLMAWGAYAHALHWLAAAAGMAAGLAVANYAMYRLKVHALQAPALKAGMVRSLKIHAEKEKARNYIKARP